MYSGEKLPKSHLSFDLLENLTRYAWIIGGSLLFYKLFCNVIANSFKKIKKVRRSSIFKEVFEKIAKI
jgi:hypothetical protein